jgi:predicted enzyme related to lactoylglutathione lyase
MCRLDRWQGVSDRECHERVARYRPVGEYPSIVIAVDDLDSAMKRVVQAGGKVLGEPLEIPGVGRYVSFFDTEGNRVSMMQPNVT